MDDMKKTIGERIREARKRLDITQAELAERTDRTQDAISGYELGQRGISSAELPLFAEALGVPVAWFFGDNDPDAELLALYEQLSPTKKRLALDYIRFLFQQSED